MGNPQQYPFARRSIRANHATLRAITRHPKRFSLGLAVVLALFVAPLLVTAGDSSKPTIRTQNSQNSATDNTGRTESSSSVEQQSITPKSSSSSNTKAKPDVRVQINGENVPMSPDGTVHREFHDNNGSSTVDIRVDNNTSSSTSSSSSLSTDVEVQSNDSEEVIQE